MTTEPVPSEHEALAADPDIALVLCSDGLLRPALRQLRALDSMPATQFVEEWVFPSGGRRRVDSSQAIMLADWLAQHTAAAKAQAWDEGWRVGNEHAEEVAVGSGEWHHFADNTNPHRADRMEGGTDE